MGLALHNPSTGTSDLSESDADSFPSGADLHPRSSGTKQHNPFSSWSTTKYHNLLSRHAQSQISSSAAPLRPHQLRALGLEAASFRTRLSAYPEPPSSISVRREKDLRRRQRHVFSPSDEDEGRDLARCGRVKLPSDRERERVPSLGRQEAFWDGRTVKRKFGEADEEDEDEEQTRELYRLGVLYHDEFERGEGFGFGVIDAGREDGWVVDVRTTTPRERKRRGKNGKGRVGQQLHLDLSFARLGDDEALARWLIEPGPDERDFERGGVGTCSDSACDPCREDLRSRTALIFSDADEEGQTEGLGLLDSTVILDDEDGALLPTRKTHSLLGPDAEMAAAVPATPPVWDFPELVFEGDEKGNDADNCDDDWEVVGTMSKTVTAPNDDRHRQIDEIEAAAAVIEARNAEDIATTTATTSTNPHAWVVC